MGIVLAGCSTSTGWVPEPDEPRSFVTTLGVDTVSVEVYMRNEDGIEGMLVERSPYTHIIEYAATLDENGHIVRLQYTKNTPAANAAGPAPEEGLITLSDGRATVTREGGSNPGTAEVEAPAGVIPTLGRNASAMFIFEQVAAQLRSGDTEIWLLGPNGSAPALKGTEVLSADTVAMDYFGSPRKGWTDAKGQLLGVSGAVTTNKSESRRVEPFLVGAMAERWAGMDVAGTGIGTPSPGAVVAISMDGANLEVNYSQPAMRGREIWGQLVPEGEVWRTGANAATHFATSADLQFGDDVLPAGTYTLWSIYADGAFTLIINSQTNQWGTVYDASLDVLRIPSERTDLTAPTERFVISIDDTEEGGQLGFEWGTVRFTVPFVVK
jgi:hypothetical protein